VATSQFIRVIGANIFTCEDRLALTCEDNDLSHSLTCKDNAEVKETTKNSRTYFKCECSIDYNYDPDTESCKINFEEVRIDKYDDATDEEYHSISFFFSQFSETKDTYLVGIKGQKIGVKKFIPEELTPNEDVKTITISSLPDNAKGYIRCSGIRNVCVGGSTKLALIDLEAETGSLIAGLFDDDVAEYNKMVDVLNREYILVGSSPNGFVTTEKLLYRVEYYSNDGNTVQYDLAGVLEDV
jgi:hypothetical protein